MVGFGKHTLFNQTVRKAFNDKSLGCRKCYWEDLADLDIGLRITRLSKGQHHWGNPHNAPRIAQSCLEEIWAGASVVLIEDSMGRVRSTILAKVVARLSDAMLGPSWAVCPCVFDARGDGVDCLYECKRWVLGSASGYERDFEQNYLKTQTRRRFHLSQLSAHAWVGEVQAHLESWAGKSAVSSAGPSERLCVGQEETSPVRLGCRRGSCRLSAVRRRACGRPGS